MVTIKDVKQKAMRMGPHRFSSSSAHRSKRMSEESFNPSENSTTWMHVPCRASEARDQEDEREHGQKSSAKFRSSAHMRGATHYCRRSKLNRGMKDSHSW